MNKYAALGSALLSMGTKIMSKPVVKNLGSTAIKAGKAAWKNPVSRNAIKGGATGMAVGALNAQPGQDGKTHRFTNALQGGLTGATIGGAMGGSQQFAPQIKNFGSEILNGVRQSVPRQMNETR